VENNQLLGMILSYRQPDPYETGPLSEYPDIVRPLVELETRAPGSWYINAVATYKEYRGKGVARKLMADAEARARSAGCHSMSLIVASENTSAIKLYEYLGFNDVGSLPVVPYPGGLHGGNWVLMVFWIAIAFIWIEGFGWLLFGRRFRGMKVRRELKWWCIARVVAIAQP